MTPGKASPWSLTPAEEIRLFFEGLGKQVISFAGFGELGYEDPEVVRRVASEVLGPLRPRDVVVNSGTLTRRGGECGIAAIYPIARERGMQTSGIHPSVALDFRATHPVSEQCEHPFFVKDDTWGGFLDGSREPSPSLQVVLDVTDELVVIGGGKHAADELQAFLDRGKRVRYYEADMNHETARDWCQRSGASIPDHRGAAHGAWLALRARQGGRPAKETS